MNMMRGKTMVLLLLVWVCCRAERQYFLQGNESEWDAARLHCQLCYKEMTSLTADNMQVIVRNLTLAYWVGLRQDLNATMLWSRWSNGDPLIFQNWYPGHPKPPQPKLKDEPEPTPAPAPSPSDTCSIRLQDFCKSDVNVTSLDDLSEAVELADDLCVIRLEDICASVANDTEPANVTHWLPPIVTNVTKEEEEGPENICVSLLSSGMWLERNCTDLLPYICYEDRFYGKVDLSMVTLNNMSLRWSPGPGDIEVYRAELTGDRNLTQNTTNLTMTFSDLTPGTRYMIQVFPVKCERDLNPQNLTFYTKPHIVKDLTVEYRTEKTVFLSWAPPDGNRDFYSVRVLGHPSWTETTHIESHLVMNLTPGGYYTISVNAEVADKSIVGDPVNISTSTKPAKVQNLKMEKSNVNETSIHLSWERPEGKSFGFRVDVRVEGQTDFNSSINTTDTELTVIGLTPGTQYNLSVVALAQDWNLEGEPVTVAGYTTPGPVTNLQLVSSEDSITANWINPIGRFYNFKIELSGQLKNETRETNGSTVTIPNLYAATKYNVTVYTQVLDKELHSRSEMKSVFTLPLKPSSVWIANISENNVTLEWSSPPNLESLQITYEVRYISDFWGHSKAVNVTSGPILVNGANNHSITGLHSGTNYTFEVRTLAGEHRSAPATTDGFTEAKKQRLTLLMQCSSEKSLVCDNSKTQDEVFSELKAHFGEKLEGNVFWELKWKKQ